MKYKREHLIRELNKKRNNRVTVGLPDIIKQQEIKYKTEFWLINTICLGVLLVAIIAAIINVN